MRKITLCTCLFIAALNMYAQPQLVADIKPGTASSNPAIFTILGGKLVFFTDSDIYTLNGTVLSASVFSGMGFNYKYQSAPYPVLDGKLYFNLMGPKTNNPSELVPWLCYYDGVNVTPVNECSATISVENVIYEGGSFYAHMNQSIRRLTWPAFNTSTLWGGFFNEQHEGYGVLAHNGNILFSGDSSLYQIWPSTDQYGEQLFSDLVFHTAPRPSTFITASDAKVYFAANTDDSGRVLFSMDTNYVATKVSRLPNGGFPNLNELAYEKGIIQMGNYLYFGANDGLHGVELMRMNLANNDIELVADINPGVADAYPCQMALFNNKLYFSALNVTTGRELYVCEADGTVHIVYDLNPGTASANPRNLTAYNNELYFSAQNANSGVELFRLANPVSINSIAVKSDEVAIFPNPTYSDTKLSFSLQYQVNQLRLTVFSIEGKICYTQLPGNFSAGAHTLSIPAATFANGTYIYELADANNNTLARGKFLKQ